MNIEVEIEEGGVSPWVVFLPLLLVCYGILFAVAFCVVSIFGDLPDGHETDHVQEEDCFGHNVDLP